MSNLTKIIGAAFLGSLLLTSCSNDFEVIQPGFSTPIIYSIINPADSTHYVRLTKSFIGEASFEELASNPENLLYDSALVTLDINSSDGYPVKTFEFTKTLLPDKNIGVFARCPNYAYVLDQPLLHYLEEGSQVRLIIDVGDSNQVITAQQIYHHAPEIIQPRDNNWTTLSLYSEDPMIVEWVDNPGFKKYELEIRINYYNMFADRSEKAFSSCFYYRDSRATELDRVKLTIKQLINPEQVFRIIGARTPENEEVIYRSFSSLDFYFRGLTPDFCEFQETYQAASDRTGQPASIVVGGFGLFTLVAVSEASGYQLDYETSDSLCFGRFTKHLNFRNW